MHFLAVKTNNAKREIARRLNVACAIFLCLAFSFASPAFAQTGGPVAAYGFSETSGTTTADASGNGNTGTLTSGAARTTAGKFGSAVAFNGNNAYVDLGNGTTLQITGSMTISAWIRAAAFPGDDAAVVSKRTSKDVGFQLDTTVDQGPRTIGFKLTNSSGVDMARYGSTALQVNQWYHISGVYDAAARTMNVYLNGVLDNGALVGTLTSTQKNSTLNVNVGRRPGNSGFGFNGTIDEVRIYNRALSAAEIQVDMVAPVGGGTTVDTTPPGAPGTLSATPSGANQINLSWSAATDNVGVTGYRVERCTGSGCSNFAQVAAPAGTNFSDTSLTAGTSYSYRVRAVDAAGNLGAYSPIASATTAAPDVVPPTAPSGLTAAAAGSAQVNLTWTASTDDVGVTGYRVERCTGSGCSVFTQIATPTTTSFSDTGLAAGTSYTYQVRATDAAGNLSAYSNFASATTAAGGGGPIAAYGFNEAAGTTTADASGNGNTGTLNGATRTTAGEFGGAVVVNGSGAYVDLGNGPTLQITGSMTISAWIRAAAFPADDAAVVSKRASTDLGFQLDTTVDTGRRTIGFKLTNASGVDVARYGTTTLQANQWYHISGVYDAAARTMNVYLNGVLDNATLAGTISATQQNSTLSVNVGRRPGASGYAFNGTIDEVRIYNRALSAAEIQADMAAPIGGGTTVDTIAPSAPGTLSATASGSNQINLAWGAATDNVGVTGYRVERCASSGCSNFAEIATATGTSFSDTSVAANTSYSYRVRATDAAGNLGAYSNIGSAMTALSSDVTPPTVPANFTGTVVGAAQINLSWSASTDDVGVSGYQLERCQGAGCNTWVRIATLTGTSFNDTGLAPLTTYRYWVRATDAAGNVSGWSTIVTLTTPAPDNSGLAAAYGFDEVTGTTTADASGNGNIGTLNGATRTSSGRFGGAIVVSGNDGYVDLGNGPTLEITGSMTISAWISAAAFPQDDAVVVSNRTAGDLGFQLDTTVDTGRRTVGFKLTNSSGADVARYGGTTLQANQWYYISGVYDAAARTLDVYVNGVLDNGTLSGTITATQQISTLNVNIGRRPGTAGFGFNGTIDEVRIYNRALSAAEVQANMATSVTGALPPDTTAPAVSIISPTGGATVTSVVSVAANATDNVGVASVQYLLDGAPLGSPATISPYSISWDTGTVAPGIHVLTAKATDFAGNSSTSTPVSVTVATQTGSTAGQWAAPTSWPIVAVHSLLLPTGEVLAWDGQTAGNDARLWNPATGVFTSVPNNLTNMFCSGHCLLPDGRALVAGGHLGGHEGLRDTNLFSPTTHAWSRVAPMAVGRWYPTTTPLPDGRVLVMGGEINCYGCFAPIPEIYNPQVDSWTQLSGASLSLPLYPHMFVLPDGRVLAAATTEAPIASRILDIPTQTWSVADPNAVDGGSSAMYAPGKIIKSGRSVDPDQPVIPSTATTYVLDMNQPTPRWRQTAPMAFARTFHTLTLLPDGTVLATGGGPTTDAVGVASAVLAAELWSPTTETWTTLASMQRPRLYHSGALLLPDARVLILGGGRFNGLNEPTDQLNSEIFSPPYLFKGARPTITSAPAAATYGANITVQTPDAASIGSVSIVRLGSVTHSINQNQFIAALTFTATAGTLTVQTPANANLAPPGHYMLFILNTSGVPSIASIVQLH